MQKAVFCFTLALEMAPCGTQKKPLKNVKARAGTIVSTSLLCTMHIYGAVQRINNNPQTLHSVPLPTNCADALRDVATANETRI